VYFDLISSSLVVEEEFNARIINPTNFKSQIKFLGFFWLPFLCGKSA
jgi:hypothetical protein